MPSQSAIFLARIGAEAYKLFETFEFTHHDDRSDLAAIMAVFENHCIGEVNAVYIRGLKMAASRHLMRVVLQASLSVLLSICIKNAFWPGLKEIESKTCHAQKQY